MTFNHFKTCGRLLYQQSYGYRYFLEATTVNAQKVLVCLKKFGYDMSNILIENLLNEKLLIRQYLIETDIHPFVAGVTFNELWDK